MDIIIGLIIVISIISIIKDIITEHTKGFLIFLGIVGGIVAIVVCTKKFGFLNVAKWLLILAAAAAVISFIIHFISVLVEKYYDRKAVKTEKKVRSYVFGQSKNINYIKLKDCTNELFSSIRLGKKHNVKDYINKALEDFTVRNANEIYMVIGQDIKEKLAVEYDKYYPEINQRFGSYCLGNCTFKDWADHCLNEFAMKNSEGGIIHYIEKNVAKETDKTFSSANYNRIIIEDDDDEDEYDEEDYDEDEYDEDDDDDDD